MKGHLKAKEKLVEKRDEYQKAYNSAKSDLEKLKVQTETEAYTLTHFTRIVTEMKEILDECKKLSESFRFSELLTTLYKFEEKIGQLSLVNNALGYQSQKTN